METWEFVGKTIIILEIFLMIFASLTTKLPFDDDQFDHVHIQNISPGVPESKVIIMLCYCAYIR